MNPTRLNPYPTSILSEWMEKSFRMCLIFKSWSGGGVVLEDMRENGKIGHQRTRFSILLDTFYPKFNSLTPKNHLFTHFSEKNPNIFFGARSIRS